MPRNRELVDLNLHIHFRTDRAVLVSDDGNRDKAVWLPLSQIEIQNDTGLMSGVVEVTVPEWLAIEKGLV